MRIALLITFNASRKEPLASLLERIHAAFLASGDGEPLTSFSFSDSPLPGYVSSVDRVLKRHPQLDRFLFSHPLMPGGPPVRQISNGSASPVAGESVEFATLLAIAAGENVGKTWTPTIYSPAFLIAQWFATASRASLAAHLTVRPYFRE